MRARARQIVPAVQPKWFDSSPKRVLANKAYDFVQWSGNVWNRVTIIIIIIIRTSFVVVHRRRRNDRYCSTNGDIYMLAVSRLLRRKTFRTITREYLCNNARVFSTATYIYIYYNNGSARLNKHDDDGAPRFDTAYARVIKEEKENYVFRPRSSAPAHRTAAWHSR